MEPGPVSRAKANLEADVALRSELYATSDGKAIIIQLTKRKVIRIWQLLTLREQIPTLRISSALIVIGTSRGGRITRRESVVT